MTTFIVLLISIGLICNSYLIGNIIGRTQKDIERDKQPPQIYIEKVNIVNQKETTSPRLKNTPNTIIDAEYEDVVTSTELVDPRVRRVLRAYKSCLIDKQEKRTWSRYT